jgi:replication initiation protein RepC
VAVQGNFGRVTADPQTEQSGRFGWLRKKGEPSVQNASGTPSASAQARPRPTGHVRKTSGHYQAVRHAEAFAGLPAGVTHPKQLLEPLRRCGSQLPFARAALDTLALLFDYTKAKDWQDGGTPLVFPSNLELAGCLGVTERTIRNHLGALESAGIIAIQRGPGNRRIPLRGKDGTMIAPYGINLAPVPVFVARLTQVSRAMRGQREELRQARRRLSIAVQEIRTALDAVEVVAFDRPLRDEPRQAQARLQPIAQEAEAEAASCRRLFERYPAQSASEQAETLAAIARGAALVEAHAVNANAITAETLSLLSENTGDPETSFRHDSTNESFDPSDQYNQQREVVAAPVVPKRAPILPFSPKLPVATARSASEIRAHDSVKIRHVIEVLPSFAELLRDYLLIDDPRQASLSDIVGAGRILATQLGASTWCWEKGCETHGAWAAALCAIVAAAKPQTEIKKSRGAFLAGMLLRPPGELNVLASFHALRKRRLN